MLWFNSPNLSWDLSRVIHSESADSRSHSRENFQEGCSTIDALIQRSIELLAPELNSAPVTKAHILIMSNGGFGGVHTLLSDALKTQCVD